VDLGEAELGKPEIVCLAQSEITNIPVLDPDERTGDLFLLLVSLVAGTKTKTCALAFVSWTIDVV
jgi:hypothetical protein